MRLTKTTLALIASVGILILSAGLLGSVASRAPIQEQSCMSFGDCDLITCNPKGSTTFTFAVTNLSNFAASSVHFNSVTPSGVTISPNPYSLTPLLPPHANQQITVTIGAGLPNGTTVCFTLDLIGKGSSHCSSIKKCIKLGACGPVQPLCASGACCGGAPHITTDPNFTPFVGKRLAVTTFPYRFNVGNLVNSTQQCGFAMAFLPANAAGGIDYDYSIGWKYTVATTGDALLPWTGYIPYGLQLFPPTGGGMDVQNSTTGAHDAVAIDLNGIMGITNPADKSQIGDVEIVCPRQVLSEVNQRILNDNSRVFDVLIEPRLWAAARLG